jgi:hypothetical protein
MSGFPPPPPPPGGARPGQFAPPPPAGFAGGSGFAAPPPAPGAYAPPAPGAVGGMTPLNNAMGNVSMQQQHQQHSPYGQPGPPGFGQGYVVSKGALFSLFCAGYHMNMPYSSADCSSIRLA